MLKNINLIIVKGLSRKRINKRRKKEADEERRRKINRSSALAFVLTSKRYVLA